MSDLVELVSRKSMQLTKINPFTLIESFKHFTVHPSFIHVHYFEVQAIGSLLHGCSESLFFK